MESKFDLSELRMRGDGALKVLVPVFSTLGSLSFIFFVLCLLYYLRFYRHGRIMLGDGAPGSYDDEQQAMREEAMYLHTLDEPERQAYFRAKGEHILAMPHQLTRD